MPVYLLAAYLIAVLIREMIALWNMRYYRKQGVYCKYIPWLGINYIIAKGKGTADELGFWWEYIQGIQQKKKDIDVIYSNSSKNIGGVLILLDPQLIQEFIKIEHKVGIKQPLVSKINLGFFWKNGADAMNDRALYGQFFKIDNLNKMAPQIIQTVSRKMGETRQSLLTSKKIEWTSVDVNLMLRNIFSDVVESILFGEKTSQPDQTPLPDLIAVYVNRSAHSAFSLGNLLSWELVQKFGLGKYCGETEGIYREIEERSWQIYQKRLQTGPKKDVNMLDLMIEQSKISGKELTRYEIAGQFILLQFAGADTSRTISQTFIYFLSDKPELQAKILEEVDARIYNESHIDFDALFNSEYFNMMTKESLRRFNPFITSSPRKLTQDITLGNLKLKKGLNLGFPVLTMHLMEKFHKDALSFDITRHTPENKLKQTKLTFMPFFAGKRICIGQYMGDMMIKVIISQMVKHFQWKRDDDYKPPMVQGLTYIHKEMTLWMRPRK